MINDTLFLKAELLEEEAKRRVTPFVGGNLSNVSQSTGGTVAVDKTGGEGSIPKERECNRRYETKYLRSRPTVCVCRPIQTSFSPSLASARSRSVLATGGCTGVPCQRDRLHRFVPFVLK